jgi:ADP-ribose pyrophosphatase YjhB (NUDIX family)
MDDYKKRLREFLLHGDKEFLPHISTDCVIFGFHNDELKVLLLKWKDKGTWCLPGGFVKRNESLDASAMRILHERTGLENIFLRQFHAFGDPHREKAKRTVTPVGSVKSWITDRFITIGYWALVEFSKVTPRPDWLSDDCRWWDIRNIPKLIYDHNIIVTKALDALRISLNNQPVGYNLLPEKFTMPDLQRLYETILGASLDRRNFQKKMLALNVLERLAERKTGGAHKSPYLYRFDKRKYEHAIKQGAKSGF